MEASISIPMVDVAMLIVSAVGAMVFFSEPVSLQKALGILLMLTGIGLLRPG
jgi:multidrug transporter EmrE-like cation transporter